MDSVLWPTIAIAAERGTPARKVAHRGVAEVVRDATRAAGISASGLPSPPQISDALAVAVEHERHDPILLLQGVMDRLLLLQQRFEIDCEGQRGALAVLRCAPREGRVSA